MDLLYRVRKKTLRKKRRKGGRKFWNRKNFSKYSVSQIWIIVKEEKERAETEKRKRAEDAFLKRIEEKKRLHQEHVRRQLREREMKQREESVRRKETMETLKKKEEERRLKRLRE